MAISDEQAIETKAKVDIIAKQQAALQGPLNSIAAGSIVLGILSYGLADMIVASSSRAMTKAAICGIHALSGAAFAGIAVIGASTISRKYSASLSTNDIENGRTGI